MTPDTTPAEETARIGPNAVIRLGEALTDRLGAETAAQVFHAAGVAHWLDEPPDAMVAEVHVTALHRALRETLDPETAADVAWDAGRRTADYLLAVRIPRPVQWLLKALPPAPASRVLLAAIGRHSWTFAGSGDFRVRPGRPLRLEIAGCPLCRGAEADAPICGYYAGTFERLYRVLVSRRTTVRQTACEAQGAAACVFAVDWSGR